jgi:alcohol dehydrogenase
MDAAKTMAVVAPDGGDDVAAYCMQPKLQEGTDQIDLRSVVPTKVPSTPALPIIAIPTTSGTASETNGGAVLTDESTHRKLIFSSTASVARETLLDPELTLKLPPYPTATCGMDVLTHAMEALTSNRQNEYQLRNINTLIRTLD